MVLRRCRQLLGDGALADEALHDTFVQVLRRPDLEIAYPSALLYRIATRTCLNQLRSRRRRPEDPATDLLSRSRERRAHLDEPRLQEVGP